MLRTPQIAATLDKLNDVKLEFEQQYQAAEGDDKLTLKEAYRRTESLEDALLEMFPEQ